MPGNKQVESVPEGFLSMEGYCTIKILSIEIFSGTSEESD